ncbi:MAG: 50S ribosomal protein L18 [Patescibacteria group bacterium]|mgnify:CR=1 FL=1
MSIQNKQEKQYRRRQRIRAKVSGTNKVPRLLAVKSNKHIAAQLINDDKGETLASISDSKMKKNKKIDQAREVGKLIAEKAKGLKIEKVVFDRAGYKYHGRIKALAEGAREGGLKF